MKPIKVIKDSATNRTYLEVKPELIRYLGQIFDCEFEFLKSHVRQLIMVDNCSAAGLLALNDKAGCWLVVFFSVNTVV
jgi:hypothetical protein